MPCNTCNKAFNDRSYQTQKQLRESGECQYTLETMIEWKNKLFCIRDNQTYEKYSITKAQLNSFIGVVLSGVSFEYNICFLVDKLNTIQPYILQIIAGEEC